MAASDKKKCLLWFCARRFSELKQRASKTQKDDNQPTHRFGANETQRPDRIQRNDRL